MLKVVDSENAVLKVPLNFSDKKIADFLKEKSVWLNKAALKLKNMELTTSQLEIDEFLYLDGEKVAKIDEKFPLKTQNQREKLVKEWYLSQFFRLEEMVREISLKTGLKYSQVKPASSVRIWGSFNSFGQMKLNWKLLILPRRLWRYVVCHELCHGKFMNHQPRFWALVQKICPDYKQLKKELSTYSFLLKNSKK